MKISIRQLGISLVAIMLAVSVLIGFVRNPEIVGGQALVVRALILNFSIFAALVAVFPLNTLFYGRPGTFGLVCDVLLTHTTTYSRARTAPRPWG